jgi:hypothetical protein
LQLQPVSYCGYVGVAVFPRYSLVGSITGKYGCRQFYTFANGHNSTVFWLSVTLMGRVVISALQAAKIAVNIMAAAFKKKELFFI